MRAHLLSPKEIEHLYGFDKQSLEEFHRLGLIDRVRLEDGYYYREKQIADLADWLEGEAAAGPPRLLKSLMVRVRANEQAINALVEIIKPSVEDVLHNVPDDVFEEIVRDAFSTLNRERLTKPTIIRWLKIISSLKLSHLDITRSVLRLPVPWKLWSELYIKLEEAVGSLKDEPAEIRKMKAMLVRARRVLRDLIILYGGKAHDMALIQHPRSELLLILDSIS